MLTLVLCGVKQQGKRQQERLLVFTKEILGDVAEEARGDAGRVAECDHRRVEERLVLDEQKELDDEVPEQLTAIEMTADRVAEVAQVAKRGWQQRLVDACLVVEVVLGSPGTAISRAGPLGRRLSSGVACRWLQSLAQQVDAT